MLIISKLSGYIKKDYLLLYKLLIGLSGVCGQFFAESSKSEKLT